MGAGEPPGQRRERVWGWCLAKVGAKYLYLSSSDPDKAHGEVDKFCERELSGWKGVFPSSGGNCCWKRRHMSHLMTPKHRTTDSCFDDHQIHLSSGHLRPRDTTLSLRWKPFPLFFVQPPRTCRRRTRKKQGRMPSRVFRLHIAHNFRPRNSASLSPSCPIAKTPLVHLTFGVHPVTGGTREVDEVACFG